MTYVQLLDRFWNRHDPGSPASCTQYASVIFYHDDDQRRLAESTRAEQETRQGTIYTRIAPAETFYRAEDYHQKFNLRGVPAVMQEFEAIYPDPIDFTDSTAAARVNGVLARQFTKERLKAEIESFGLSEEANELLLTYARD